MSKIHVNRNGNSLGTFTLDEVKEGLANGKFLPSDLAWREGMQEWKLISELPDLVAEPGAVNPADSSDPAASEVQTPWPGEADGGMVAEDGPAWEQRDTLGFFPAMIETIKSVLLDPMSTFASMKKTGGLGGPLLYYAILSIIGGIASVLYNVLIQAPTLAQMGGSEEAAAVGLGAGVGIMGMMIALPFIIIIGAFVGSGIYHLCLMLVGEANEPYEATFRVMMYATGSTAIMNLVPFCGGSVAGIWGLVLTVIGFIQVHKAPTGKAILAVLLPVIVCCVVGIIAAMAVGGLGAVAATQAAQ